MTVKNYKLATSQQLDSEMYISYDNFYNNNDEEDTVELMETSELLNKSVLVLLDILKNKTDITDIDIAQEIVDKLDPYNINDSIIYNLLADRIDYINSSK